MSSKRLHIHMLHVRLSMYDLLVDTRHGKVKTNQVTYIQASVFKTKHKQLNYAYKKDRHQISLPILNILKQIIKVLFPLK